MYLAAVALVAAACWVAGWVFGAVAGTLVAAVTSDPCGCVPASELVGGFAHATARFGMYAGAALTVLGLGPEREDP